MNMKLISKYYGLVEHNQYRCSSSMQKDAAGIINRIHTFAAYFNGKEEYTQVDSLNDCRLV